MFSDKCFSGNIHNVRYGLMEDMQTELHAVLPKFLSKDGCIKSIKNECVFKYVCLKLYNKKEVTIRV